jgi:peptidoglycan/xylan/chitin deacetylase (PgdA/CDA1 family)
MKNKLRNILLQLGSFLYSNKDSKVLFYHDIHKANTYSQASTSLDLFMEHIKIIRAESFEIVSEITRKENQIKLQLDDGYKGVYDCLEYLIEEKIPIEIFIITSEIGNPNFLNEKQILELLNSGLVKISSHSHSHLELNQIDKKSLKYELEKSKEIIESLTKTTTNSICYPLGKFSSQVIKECSLSNYEFQYSSLAGSYYDNPFENVYRRNLVQFANTKELKLVLKSANSIFNKLYFAKHFSR